MPTKNPFKLPEGAALFKKPIAIEVGGWSKTLKYDAKLERFGIEWLRVHLGFGADRPSAEGPREDWVANIKIGGIAVGEIDWKRSFFDRPPEHKTIEAAMDAKIKRGVFDFERKVEEARLRLDWCTEDLVDLKRAARRAEDCKGVAPKKHKEKTCSVCHYYNNQ